MSISKHKLAQALKNSGISMDIVKKLAEQVAKGDPNLEKQFKEKAQDKSFQKLVDQMYDNVENLIEAHDSTSVESPENEDDHPHEPYDTTI